VVCALQREGAQEEAADQQPGGGQHEEAAGQDSPLTEQADGEQGAPDPPLNHREDSPCRGGEHEREHGGCGCPAVAASIDQAVDSRTGSCGDQDRAWDIEAAFRCAGLLPGGRGQRYRDEQGDADWHAAAGRVTADDAAQLITATLLAAFTPPAENRQP